MPGVALASTAPGSTDDIPQAPPNAPPVGSTADLEQQAQNAPGQLGQALQAQQQALQTQQQPSPQQPADDPLAPMLDSMVQRRSQLMQQTAPSQSSGIKGMLGNFFSGMGNGMMRDAGLPTPQQQLQDLDSHIALVTNARTDYLKQQSDAQLRQAQMQNLNRPLTPEVAQSISHPELAGQVVSPDVMASISSENRGKEAAQINAETRADALKENTPSVQMPLDQKTADMLQIPSQFVGKNLTPADWKLIDARSQALGYQKIDRGFDGKSGGIWMADRAGNLLHQMTPVSESARATKLAAGRIAPVYAYDPVSKSTVLTTAQQAQAQNMQGIRPVKQGDIEKDTHDSKVLNDVASKANRVIDTSAALDQDAGQKLVIANALSAAEKDSQFRAGAFGTELPTGWLNKLLERENLGHASQQSRDYITAVLSAREASMGMQKVLTGSARASESQISALLQTLPGVEPDSAMAKQKMGAFTQNIDFLRQGIPKLPGVDIVPIKTGDEGKSPSAQQPAPTTNNVKPHAGIIGGAINFLNGQ